jgi:hypothetical protein
MIGVLSLRVSGGTLKLSDRHFQATCSFADGVA